MMEEAAAREDFEKAATLRDTLKDLERATQNRQIPKAALYPPHCH